MDKVALLVGIVLVCGCMGQDAQEPSNATAGGADDSAPAGADSTDGYVDCGVLTVEDYKADSARLHCFKDAVAGCKKVRATSDGGAYGGMVAELDRYDDKVCVQKMSYKGRLDSLVCYNVSGDMPANMRCSSEIKRRYFTDETDYYGGFNLSGMKDCGSKRYDSEADDMWVSACFGINSDGISTCRPTYMFDYGNEGRPTYLHVKMPYNDSICLYEVYYKGQLHVGSVGAMRCYDRGTKGLIGCPPEYA